MPPCSMMIQILDDPAHPEFYATFHRRLIPHPRQGRGTDHRLESARPCWGPPLTKRENRRPHCRLPQERGVNMSDWLEELPPQATCISRGSTARTEVECIIPDIPAFARGLRQCRDEICAVRSIFTFPDSILYQTITGEWGDAAVLTGFIEKT